MTDRFNGTWIPTKERRPKKSGEYIAQTKEGWITSLSYSKKHDKWNAYDHHLPKHAIDVVAWMEHPPKYEGE